MEVKFIAFADRRFARLALVELRRLFADAEIKRVESGEPKVLFLVSTGKGIDPGQSKTLSYIDTLLPVFALLKDIDAEYYVVAENIINALEFFGKESFRLEAKRFGYRTSDRAKDIEVKIGRAVESRGYKADLKNPEIQVYVLLTASGAIIGISNEPVDYVLDAFRHFNKANLKHLNRSEFKLIQAIEYFGVDINKVKTSMDVGAAPGGWTHYLLECGIKVMAVDKAALDYAFLDFGRGLVVANDDEFETLAANITDKRIEVVNEGGFWKRQAKDIFNGYEFVHLRSNISDAGRVGELGLKFDLLTIDMNKGADEVAKIAASLSELLHSKAALIMTAKLPEKKPEEYISDIEAEIGAKFEGIRYKKLPHNREEFTVYATCK